MEEIEKTFLHEQVFDPNDLPTETEFQELTRAGRERWIQNQSRLGDIRYDRVRGNVQLQRDSNTGRLMWTPLRPGSNPDFSSEGEFLQFLQGQEGQAWLRDEGDEGVAAARQSIREVEAALDLRDRLPTAAETERYIQNRSELGDVVIDPVRGNLLQLQSTPDNQQDWVRVRGPIGSGTPIGVPFDDQEMETFLDSPLGRAWTRNQRMQELSQEIAPGLSAEEMAGLLGYTDLADVPEEEIQSVLQEPAIDLPTDTREITAAAAPTQREPFLGPPEGLEVFMPGTFNFPSPGEAMAQFRE